MGPVVQAQLSPSKSQPQLASVQLVRSAWSKGTSPGPLRWSPAPKGSRHSRQANESRRATQDQAPQRRQWPSRTFPPNAAAQLARDS
jgi:hypothetical protein